MNLAEQPEIVNWPESHYVFLEEIGPFANAAPKAWSNVHSYAQALSKHNQITGAMSLYNVGPKIYRAGFTLAAPSVELPPELRYERFKGGKFSRFVLTGPYKNLPQATGRVFEIVAEKKIEQRDDFCIENYANDPNSTPEEELITEILIPTV